VKDFILEGVGGVGEGDDDEVDAEEEEEHLC